MKELLDGRARWFQYRDSFDRSEVVAHLSKECITGLHLTSYADLALARAYAARRVIDEERDAVRGKI